MSLIHLLIQHKVAKIDADKAWGDMIRELQTRTNRVFNVFNRWVSSDFLVLGWRAGVERNTISICISGLGLRGVNAPLNERSLFPTEISIITDTLKAMLEKEFELEGSYRVDVTVEPKYSAVVAEKL